MVRIIGFLTLGSALFIVGTSVLQGGGKDDAGITVDKEKRVIKIDAKMAPRKLEHLKDIYPLEVVACWPHPKGKKAHETLVTIEAKPSAVHKALVDLGLKPGNPVMGETKEKAQGPEVNLFLEFKGDDGEMRKVSIDRTMVDKTNGKAFPRKVKWIFTGSVMTKADSTKDEKVYGADFSGTLIAIFPVTDETVFQTDLYFKDQEVLRLEVNTKLLPKEGTAVKLIIEVPAAK
jgi:hypothetical protein